MAARRRLVVLDSAALVLSALCLVHCLALPLLMALLPWALSGFVSADAFHLWMLLAVAPSSLAALLVGTRRHGDRLVLWSGLAGVVLLATGSIGGFEHWISELQNTTLTVIGATLLAGAHGRNFLLHRRRHHETAS